MPISIDRTPNTESGAPLITYNFAILRVVPHVHLGAFIPVGVIVHARTAEFLGMKVITELERLRRCVPDVDSELLSKYLVTCRSIAHGDPAAGPVALSPTSERFHWLTAPRSDVIQCSAIHEGLTTDPAAALEKLFSIYVGDDT